MEITFKEACFDLTEGATKWRVWFYADGDVRVLKDGNLIKQWNKPLRVFLQDRNKETLSAALLYIEKAKRYEKTT